jgi:hypothetical protein
MVAEADAVQKVEGRIWASVHASLSGAAGVEDQGMRSKGSPVNPGELTISSRSCAGVARIRSGTRPTGQEGSAHGSEYALIEGSCRQGQPEATVIDSPAVLRTHSTDESGEPQGSRKGRPGHPPEGRGEQMGGVTQ